MSNFNNEIWALGGKITKIVQTSILFDNNKNNVIFLAQTKSLEQEERRRGKEKK
jgi:hypothetical protein